MALVLLCSKIGELSLTYTYFSTAFWLNMFLRICLDHSALRFWFAFVTFDRIFFLFLTARIQILVVGVWMMFE